MALRHYSPCVLLLHVAEKGVGNLCMWLYTLVFGLGAALAGMMAGLILALQVGMGESIYILMAMVLYWRPQGLFPTGG